MQTEPGILLCGIESKVQKWWEHGHIVQGLILYFQGQILDNWATKDANYQKDVNYKRRRVNL